MQYPQRWVEVSNPGLSARRGLIGWWLNLTAPPKPTVILDVAARERMRKAELTSISIPAIFAFLLLLVSNSLADPSTAQAVVGMGIGLLIAAILNRFGRVRVAAYLIPTLFMILSALAVVGAVGLDVISLPAYDLFVVPVFLTSLTGNRRAPWFFGIAAIAFILLDFSLQPHLLVTARTSPNGSATNFDTLAYYTGIFGWWGMVNRHVGSVFFAAFFGWLGARSVDSAITRADRAEEIAELERRELDRQHELEEGVRQLLAVHVHLANGDFNVRAPAIRNPLLWQIGSSLNNLISRLGRLAQADFAQRRIQEEANRITEAIYMVNSGRQPIWPAPSNTPLDRLVEVLRSTLGPRTGSSHIPQAPQQQLPPSGPGGYPGMGSVPTPGTPPPNNMSGYPDRPSGAYPGSQPMGSQPVPDWIHTLMPNDNTNPQPGQHGQPMPPMSPMSPISPMPPNDPRGQMPGPVDPYGAPVNAGYGQPPVPPAPPDANPWNYEPGKPLDDNDLPEWLRPGQE